MAVTTPPVPSTPTTPSTPSALPVPAAPPPAPGPDLARIAADYDRAARAYGAAAGCLRASVPAAAALEVGEQEAAVLAIAHGCAADYLSRGAQAARDVAERLRAWAALPATGSALPDAAVAGAVPSGALSARWYEEAAGELYGWVRLLGDDAEAVAARTGDGALVGDTHPYGDVVFGIVIPYLCQAADILGRLGL